MVLFILKFVAILAVCRAGYLEEYIYGGEKVARGQFPYLVSLERNGNHFCGGALIRRNAVLTAAHCTAIARPSAVIVRAGNLILGETSKNVQVRRASLFIAHENYNSKLLDSDLSLIKTESPFTLSDSIKLTTLPPSGAKYYGQTATIVGWGQTETSTLSKVLLKSRMALITPRDCATRFRPVPITYNMLCGIDKQTSKRGICSGDSGGPTLVQNTVVGINSFVSKPQNLYCDTRLPSVFTDVAAFVPWIKRKLNTHFGIQIEKLND